jgi:class 3 adenylate cyclase/tetratricopeptide (TPR) repeat protein
VSDVEELLISLGLAEYASAFADNAVDGDVLADLTDADLKDLGVHALGHRKKILKAIAALKEPAGPPPAPDAEVRAQRRQLTLMFADLADSTRLSRSMDLEAYRDLIRTYQDTAKQAIERQGGYVAKYLGDGVLAYFGYPQSHEDDAERAIRAGRALIDALPGRRPNAGGPALGVRIGVETGPVVVGDIIGEAASQEHAVVGETPNLAARLQAIAAPDTIVVGPVTRRLADGAASFHPLGDRDLKGFTAPVPVWRVDAVAGATDRLERGRGAALSPLIGRRAELGALASAFARMRAGETLCAHLVGEPGIGKSRLAHEFLRQTRDAAALLAGHCAAHGGSTAFFPFIDLLRRSYLEAAGAADGAALRMRLAADGLHPERHVPYLLKLLDVEDPEKAALEHDLIGVRTQEALIRLVVEHGRIRPTILFINDLHWIDERSTAVLEALIRDPARQGLLVLCTFRRRYKPPWQEHPGVEDIRLEPLSTQESLELFRSRGASGDDPALADIVERAGGNPLFLEELARHVTEAARGAVEGRSQTIPETLAGLLMQRVDSVSPAARRHAETASVAGRVFEAALLGDGPEAAVATALAELEAGGLIVADGRRAGVYRFRHALVQEVIYGSLLEADRRRLHRQVGERLRARRAGREAEVAEDLARHFDAAGETKAAARYAFMAGEKALGLFALRDASTWFGMCLALTPDDGGPGTDLLMARAIVNQTQVLCWNGDFPGMMGLAQSHLPRIRALGEMVEASRALTWIGEGYMHVGRLEEARAELERALELGRAIDDEMSVGYASGELLWLDTITGGRERIETLPGRCDALEAIAARLGDNYLALLARYARWASATQRGELAAALEAARGLSAFGERTGYPPALCWGACMRADAEARAGNLVEAERAARVGQAAAACEFDRLMAELALGMTLAAVGRTEAGLELLARAPWRTDRIGALYFGYAGDIAYGRALCEAGELERGLAWLRDGVEHFERIGNQRAACMAALELARIGSGQSADPAQGGLFRRGLRSLLKPRRDIRLEMREWLAHVLVRGEPLEMCGARAEAHLLLAGLAERDEGVAAAQYHLDEARALARPLGWLSLEQQINAEIRRLETARL